MADWDDDEFEHLAKQVEELQKQFNRKTRRAITKLLVPALAEFVLGEDFLNQHKIYPAQLTLLRVIFLELDGLTAYDDGVMADWGGGFEKRPPEDGSTRWLYEPTRDRALVLGTPPDVRARMQLLREMGRRWFREVNLVVGRRGGKGHVSALVCAMLVYYLLTLEDPQDYFGMASDKRLVIPVFAGNRDQARANLFGDIVATIVNGPVFAPYVVHLYRDRLVIATPADLDRPDRPFEGSIEIVAKEATGLAGRGPASPFMFFDEMAFVDAASSSAAADEVYAAAVPAMDQFGEWSMVLEASSPHHELGQFFEIHCRGRELDVMTGKAAYPEVLTLQHTSWGLYRDADIATTLRVANEGQAALHPELLSPDGKPLRFPRVGRPIVADDAQMAQERRSNPQGFAVEREGQWAKVHDAALDPVAVQDVFKFGARRHAREVYRGNLNTGYVIMVDPAEKRDAFAWIIGHREPNGGPEDRAFVQVDCIRRYLPADYDGELPVDDVLDDLAEDIENFSPDLVITDQHGGTYVVQGLRKRLFGRARPRGTQLAEHHRTHDKNLDATRFFREKLALRQVCCYEHPQLLRELLHLQETRGKIHAPTRGSVLTDDLAIALIFLTQALMTDDPPIAEALGGLPIIGHPGRPPVDDALAHMFGASHRGDRVRPGERAYRGGPKRLPPRT